MQLNITLKDRSLSVSLGDKPAFDLRIEESLWNRNWKVNHAGREFAAIKKKFRRFFSYDADVKISSGTETLLLRYANRQPNISFEYQGSGFQIVFHANNRFSYFQGNTQFAVTELKEVSFKGTRYGSVFNEKVISPEIFLLSHLVLIYLNTVSDSEYGLSTVTHRSFFHGEARAYDYRWTFLP